MLSNYMTASEIAATLTDLASRYFTSSQINNMLSYYLPTADINTLLSSSLSNYHTMTEVDALIADFLTDAEIDALHAALIAPYLTATQINTLIADYYTMTQVDTILANYMTDTEIAAADAALIAPYLTATQINALVGANTSRICALENAVPISKGFYVNAGIIAIPAAVDTITWTYPATLAAGQSYTATVSATVDGCNLEIELRENGVAVARGFEKESYSHLGLTYTGYATEDNTVVELVSYSDGKQRQNDGPCQYMPLNLQIRYEIF